MVDLYDRWYCFDFYFNLEKKFKNYFLELVGLGFLLLVVMGSILLYFGRKFLFLMIDIFVGLVWIVICYNVILVCEEIGR